MAFNPPRLNCRVCGKPDLYPRQAYCRACFGEYLKLKSLERQVEKAIKYPAIKNLDGEVWVELEEEPGYSISNMGRAKCLNYRRQKRENFIYLSESRKGEYLKLDIRREGQIRKMYLIHRLIGKYFVVNPKPDEYDKVLHIDENKQNNKWDNLKWGTSSKNRLDYIAHIGKDNLRRETLTDGQVIEIYNSNETQQALALRYNVNASTIWMIKTGYRRSSITGAKNTDKRRNYNEKV